MQQVKTIFEQDPRALTAYIKESKKEILKEVSQACLLKFKEAYKNTVGTVAERST